MKILLTGSSGLSAMYARALQSAIVYRHRTLLPKPAGANGLARTIQLDASEPEGNKIAIELWPDTIVNCAAISNATSVEADAMRAEKINVALPRLLAQLSTHLGALTCISTDMVFDGQSEQPYRSTDMPRQLISTDKPNSWLSARCLSTTPKIQLSSVSLFSWATVWRNIHEKLIAAISW